MKLGPSKSRSSGAGVKPTHRFRFDESSSPLLDALSNYTTLTSLIAGFSVADFGSFEADDWPTSSAIGQFYTLLYIGLMAAVAGNSLAMSIKGVLIVATFYRSRNQVGGFKQACMQAAEAVRAECERSEDADVACQIYQKTVTAVLTGDMKRSLQVAGKSGGSTASAKVKIAPALDGEGVMEVTIYDPSREISELAFGLLQGYMIFNLVLAYMVAQTMKALRATKFDTFGLLCCTTVAIILCYVLADVLAAALLPLLSSACLRRDYTTEEDRWKQRWQPQWLLNKSAVARLAAKLND